MAVALIVLCWYLIWRTNEFIFVYLNVVFLKVAFIKLSSLIGKAGITITRYHYNDVKMSPMVSQITSLTSVYSTLYSGTDQRKHQSSASLTLVWGIHRWPVNSPHKRPVTRKMFPFDDVIIFIVGISRLGPAFSVLRQSPASFTSIDSVTITAMPNMNPISLHVYA